MSKRKAIKKERSGAGGINRRTFLKSVGLTSVGLAALEGEGLVGKLKAAGVFPRPHILGPDRLQAKFLINNREWITEIEPQTVLVDVIRENLNLTGTKIGCYRGSCGACTIILDGRAINSCMMFAVDAINIPVQTIEGLTTDRTDTLQPLQASFIEHDAMQCGFCTSGMIMSCQSLLNTQPHPSDQEIKQAVSGNLCRCGTYPNILNAVRAVSSKKNK
jgi:xanthine dehydrogenase YagT iron-sulfur-binding subunit